MEHYGIIMNFNNIDHSQIANLIYLSLLLILLISGILFRGRIKISELLMQVIGWLAIIVVILIAYSFRFELFKAKDRVYAELFPSQVVSNSPNQVSVMISDDGHFYIDILLDQKSVRFMIDTGASDLVLNAQDAKKVGIDVKKLSSFRKYQTANGEIISGITKIKVVEISPTIKLYDVAASVSSADMGRSLLGMSFLKKFKKYEFYQDRLVLTY